MTTNETIFGIRWPDQVLEGDITIPKIDKFPNPGKLCKAIVEHIHFDGVQYLGSKREYAIEGRPVSKMQQIQNFKRDFRDTPFTEINEHLIGCQIFEEDARTDKE